MSKVTRIRKDRTNQAKTGQFKNIVNAARTRKISLGNAQNMIKKLVKAKKSGGVIRANSGKSVKDGKILSTKEKNEILLAKAKKKINDPNYNVASGEIQKNKNNQTNVKKNIKDAKIRKKERLDKNTKVVNTGRPNENKRVLKKGNFGEDIQKLIGLTPAGFLRKKAVKNIFNMFKSKKPSGSKDKPKQIEGPKKVNVSGGGGSGTRGQGSGKFNPPVVKPRNTKIKNPSTSVANRPNQNRISSNRGNQQLANRAVVTTGLSELIKPKKSIAGTNKKKKDFGLGGTDQIKKPSVRQGPPKGPLKSKPVKKKSRSNISNSSSYDADFTRKGLEKRGLKAKNFMSPKNFASTTKEKERKIGIAGNFNTGGKMVKRANNGLKPAPEGNKGKGVRMLPESVRNNMGFMRGGGKVVKMRGGGAATKGMNFNKGY